MTLLYTRLLDGIMCYEIMTWKDWKIALWMAFYTMATVYSLRMEKSTMSLQSSPTLKKISYAGSVAD